MKIPKNRPVENSLLLAEQAERLSGRILSTREAETIGSEENPLREAARTLSGDYVRPLTMPLRIRPGQIADPTPLNKLFGDVKNDLEILARINTALEDALVTGHNTVVTKENDVVGELKTLRDRIAALKLYATDITDDDMYTVFSFTDGSKIKVPDEGVPLTYDEMEGALMLPVVNVIEPEISDIQIVDTSNGVPGNNFDRARQRNGILDALVDNQPSTIFEYERVGNRRPDPLRLVLKIQLKEPTVINRVTVNPANLGTTNWVKIEDIQVQVDQRLTSVKGDVQAPSWDLSDDPFRLSPATAKFAAQGAYTFKPRLAKAVQITFTQDEPHFILNGRRQRYVIALRDISVQQVEFEGEGAFLLAQQSFQRPARAMGFIQNLKPFEESLASIEYSLSTDGGVSWKEVVSFENKDSAKTEALILDAPAASVTVKGKIKRSSEGFQREIGQGEINLINRSKVVSAGTISGPISLESKPQHYLEVIETRYGHSGDYGPKFFLGKGVGTVGYSQLLELPMVFDKADLSILVNGEVWPRLASFPDETTKGFLYDPFDDYPKVVFGDGVALADGGMGGAVPPPGSELYLVVEKNQNPRIEAIEKGYRLWLKYGASKVKQSTVVIFQDLKIQNSTVSAGPDSTVLEVPWEHANIAIVTIGTPEVNFINDGVAVAFQNGEVEFENLAEGNYYSVDYENGKIYLAEPVPRFGGDMTVGYEYNLRKLIPEDQWDYHDTENAINVYSDLIQPKRGMRRRFVTLEERVWDLDGVNLQARPYSIIKGTVRGVDENGVVGMSRVLQNEVAFINGSAEFERLRVVGGSLLGYFSVNYEENTVHLPSFDGVAAEDRGFLPGRIIWQYVSSEVHYNLGRKLEVGREYEQSEAAVEPTPYFLDRLVDLNRRLGRSVDLHVRYNIIGESVIDGALLERYYSPVLRDLAIVGVGIDPRLGTLESL